MLAIALRTLVPLTVVVGLLILEEWISIPSCKELSVVHRDGMEESGNDSMGEEQLRVMLVGNLLLMGSESGYFNTYFRDPYMAKFFKKSYQRVQPDMLIVLGDVSARGFKLTKSNWLSVFQQLQMILGPFLDLPLHIVLGDRDIGECSKLDVKSIKWLASNLPGLDSSGCAAFEMSNTSFVSLNTVAMLCGNSDLRFSIEKVIERESSDLQTDRKSSMEIPIKTNGNLDHFRWRESGVPSSSGPVLLLHFPLHRTSNNCGADSSPKSSLSSGPDAILKFLHNREVARSGPYELLQTLPPNATEYMFQALKPRIIFSAHSNGFCDHTHNDGTREVTVPATTWDARDDPGFVVATFGKNRGVAVSHCSLLRESHSREESLMEKSQVISRASQGGALSIQRISFADPETEAAMLWADELHALRA